MVGPLSETERRRGNRLLAVGFVMLVGVSAGLMAVTAGATLLEAGLVLLIGLVVGVALLVAIGVNPPGRGRTRSR